MQATNISQQPLLLLLLLFQYYHSSIIIVSSYFTGKPERTQVILYNKPANVVTTHAIDDILGRQNVYQDISTWKGYVSNKEYDLMHNKNNIDFSSLHAVGRLDADTTGLLLLTNDGGLVHHVTNKEASTHQEPISKTYEAVIMGHHDKDSDLKPIYTTGVDIGTKYGGLCQPVKEFEILDHPTSTTTLVSLTLLEGKNRQVRRMFHALGSGVMKLRRTRIGEDLTLDSIEEPGQWRFLSDFEIRTYLNWNGNYNSIMRGTNNVQPRRRRQKKF